MIESRSIVSYIDRYEFPFRFGLVCAVVDTDSNKHIAMDLFTNMLLIFSNPNVAKHITSMRNIQLHAMPQKYIFCIWTAFNPNKKNGIFISFTEFQFTPVSVTMYFFLFLNNELHETILKQYMHVPAIKIGLDYNP